VKLHRFTLCTPVHARLKTYCQSTPTNTWHNKWIIKTACGTIHLTFLDAKQISRYIAAYSLSRELQGNYHYAITAFIAGREVALEQQKPELA
jgi:hypothetical protein